VLKCKYYPNCGFLEATRKRRSSDTWRAIRHGREVLKMRLINRIGPGTLVNIWTDNSIPGIKSLKPRVRLPGVTIKTVDELFETGNRQWNEQLVRQSFIAIDAEEVLRVRPSRTMDSDVLAWAPEKTGVYSVRSAYQLLKSEQAQRIAEKEGGGATSTGGVWWKRLSKLKIPPKVRIFWWMALNGFLPSKAELKRRHIREEGYCDVCGDPSESLYHVMITCPWAKRFWAEVKATLGRKLPELHPSTWATDLLSGSVCSMDDAAVFVCECWSLWSGRNRRVHGRSAWSPCWIFWFDLGQPTN
jgi:hypothetical protein